MDANHFQLQWTPSSLTSVGTRQSAERILIPIALSDVNSTGLAVMNLQKLPIVPGNSISEAVPIINAGNEGMSHRCTPDLRPLFLSESKKEKSSFQSITANSGAKPHIQETYVSTIDEPDAPPPLARISIAAFDAMLESKTESRTNPRRIHPFRLNSGSSIT